jgi:hypothetical protein
MKLTRHHRALLAWTLYVCVLFNGAADTRDLGSKNLLNGNFSCPLYATVTLNFGLLFCLNGLLRPCRQRFLPRPAERQPPPRFSWPSANPRASPQRS